MGSCINIGVYIGEGDKDIAAWFNLLQRNKQSRSRWVRGLLAANALDKPLQIGVVDCRAPLIRDGPQKGDKVEPKGGFSHGWQIRGPKREFVIGSVVNISIRGDEAHDLLNEVWANGHKRAPFVKALIRRSLKTGEKDIPPKADALRRIWSEYLISVNGKMTGKKAQQSLPLQEKVASEDWAQEQPPATTEVRSRPEAPAIDPTVTSESEHHNDPQLKDPERAFSFQADPAQQTESPPKPKLGRNPLLSQI